MKKSGKTTNIFCLSALNESIKNIDDKNDFNLLLLTAYGFIVGKIAAETKTTLNLEETILNIVESSEIKLDFINAYKSEILENNDELDNDGDIIILENARIYKENMNENSLVAKFNNFAVHTKDIIGFTLVEI